MVGVTNKQHFTLNVLEDNGGGIGMIYTSEDGSRWQMYWNNGDELTDTYIYRAAKIFTKIVEYDLDPFENGFESNVFGYGMMDGEVAFYDSGRPGEIEGYWDGCGDAGRKFLNLIGYENGED